MNTITLSHTTALAALRDLRLNGNWNETLIRYNNNEGIFHRFSNSKLQMRTCKKFIRHAQPENLPCNSLINITDKILITGPELLTILMARDLSYARLSLLVLELCGKYTIDEKTNTFNSVNDNITSIKKIKNYLIKYKNNNNHGHGLKKLEEVLDYCQDYSASPMESRMYVKLCGKRRHGFYECKGLQFNKPIKISISSEKIAGQQIITPDLSESKNKVAIEYDSAVYHENQLQGQRDKRRRDALVNDGWKVYTIVPQQLQDPYTFDPIAKNILKDLKQDYRIRGKNFQERRNLAFDEIR